MASSSWLQSGLGDTLHGETDARRRDLLHSQFDSGEGGEYAEGQQQQVGAHFGGLHITPPVSWREYERLRLDETHVMASTEQEEAAEVTDQFALDGVTSEVGSTSLDCSVNVIH